MRNMGFVRYCTTTTRFSFRLPVRLKRTACRIFRYASRKEELEIHRHRLNMAGFLNGQFVKAREKRLGNEMYGTCEIG
jgi:hypothetical protein